MKKLVGVMGIATILIALAQTLWKLGSQEIVSILSFLNLYIITGGLLYIIASGLYIYSLKHGDVTTVYPMISLSFVWGFFISTFFFNDPISIFNLIGLTSIIAGVILIGK